MIDLSFSEQVKIVLRRRGMTIKQLAETIERVTGKPMSRQNLTQRLTRDNFQEKDMRIVAKILGCHFHLDILECFHMDDETVRFQLDKIEEKNERTRERYKNNATKKEEKEEITVGDVLSISDQYEDISRENEEKESEDIDAILHNIEGRVRETVEADKQRGDSYEVSKKGGIKGYFKKMGSRLTSPRVNEADEFEKYAPEEEGRSIEFKPETEEEMLKNSLEPEVEDLMKGEMNPYTGHEYETNSVRTHASKIGYVQVYDRRQHCWIDMTEWAFLGNEETKKRVLGKKYKEPIYLD